jgi:phage tail tube protein FII
MSNNLYIMEGVNLFCQDTTVAENSQHLTLSEMKLPGLDTNYADHLAGGAPVAVEVDLYVQHLEATFTLAGWQPEVMEVFKIPQNVFTAYGAVRDRRSGQVYQGKAVLQGQLGRVNPTAWTRGAILHHEYSIRSIMHYELYLDQERIYYWDFFTNSLIIGDRDANEAINTALGLAGIAGGA